MTDFLKIILLMNALFLIALGGFYELVMLCGDLGISAWWAAVPYIAVYGVFLRKQCGEAFHG